MKPALVFVHGIGGSSAVWPAQMEHFGDHYRCLAWNIPGYGGRGLIEPFSFEALARQLGDDLRAFGIERCVLVGHSFGGMIAQRIAADAPERLEAVVLSGTSPAFGPPDGDFQRQFLAERLGPLDDGKTMGQLAPSIVDTLMAPGADADGRALAVEAMANVPEPVYRASMELLATFDMRSALGGISVPTLVLAAEHDTSAPAGMMERMAHKIPNARFTVIEGAGHLANLERPDAFNAALDAFLKEV